MLPVISHEEPVSGIKAGSRDGSREPTERQRQSKKSTLDDDGHD